MINTTLAYNAKEIIMRKMLRHLNKKATGLKEKKTSVVY